ncbi:MAG: putative Ig domain-containing protein [Verrucomicrobia bacterium]|nr:putative Ig domain-containing protein [Verrucomicrobiota bacterium]
MNRLLRLTFILAATVTAGHAADAAPEPSPKVAIRGTTVSGFVHPGIGLTKEKLENARAQVIAKRDPWFSAYQKLAAHPNSAEKVSCRNQSTKDPSKPDSDTFDSRGMEARLKGDADKAMRQALMYWFTAKQCHRANAMNIIRTWAKLDPKKFKSFSEDHIHASYPVQTLVAAAELMRYTEAPWPDLTWSATDTEVFTRNFVMPAATTFFDRNGHFMNQAGYPMAAAISCYIFTNDRTNYAKRIEWFTVNKDAPNKGWSFSIRDLARLVDRNAITGEKVSPPIVQLVEMGRDQAHAADDAEIFMNISRMLNAQESKVDPKTGELSNRPDAVPPYAFLDNRIPAAADYFCRFMLGYDTPWIPTASDIAQDGTVHQIYPRIADNYRGRIRGLDIWDAHYYLTYRLGVNVAEKFPYYDEAFRKRIVNSDFDWIHIPKEAAGEGARVPQTAQEPDLVEIDERVTPLDKHASVITEGGTSFVRVKPTPAGSRLAVLSCDTDSKSVLLRIRTTGSAEIAMSGFRKPWLLPNTHGEWRTVSYTMGPLERFINIVFFTVRGSPDYQMDLDQLVRKPDTRIGTPAFRDGGGDRRLIAYAGAPVKLGFAADGGPVRIISSDLPSGATLDPKTGDFQWQPAVAGEFTFIVTADDGQCATARKVRIIVTADRASALAKVAEAHDPQTDYVEAGVRRAKAIYDDAVRSVAVPDESVFAKMLSDLQSAFDRLEPLTPLLPDGSMDFPRIVASSDIGADIALLSDNNDDTFPVYLLARDLNYVFDFGEGFRFSATAFAMEGRLNFENRTQDTAFFGSDDGKSWSRLTPEIATAPKELTRVEVDPSMRDRRFRFLKIEKTNRRSSPLFEPAELRIFGRRLEAE